MKEPDLLIKATEIKAQNKNAELLMNDILYQTHVMGCIAPFIGTV